MKKRKKSKSGTKYRKTVTLGRDLNGRLIRKDFYAETKHELNEKIDNYKIKYANGDIEEKAPIMPFSVWADTWFSAYKDDQLETSTLNAIKSLLRIVKKYFGDAPINYIREADITKFFKDNNHYTSGYLQRLYITLKQIFNKAVSNGIITKNPMADMKAPKGKGKAKEKKAYNREEYRKVIEFSKTHKDGLGAFIMLKTGVRIAELLGLKGNDIDLEKGLVYVRRISTDSGVKEKGKTKNALRAIPIDEECKQHLNNQLICHTNKYIFTKQGKPQKPINYRATVFKRFQKDLLNKYPEMPQMTPHEYRHTYGTLLYQAGTELYTLSKIMGHANTLITQKTYVHETIEDIIKNVAFPENVTENENDREKIK